MGGVDCKQEIVGSNLNCPLCDTELLGLVWGFWSTTAAPPEGGSNVQNKYPTPNV